MTTVVVADDSPTLRRIVAGVLEGAGLDVVLADDGVQAIQAVFRTMPDVVVFDVQMPRLSGYVAARVLKDDWQTADIPVLFLSSLSAASDRYWGARAGAQRFLTKDFEAPDLVEAVQQVLVDAERARGGRPALKPDAVDLSDDDVLARVTDLLDRKLFELSVTSDVTAIAADVLGFEETVAALLQTLVDVVDCDLVGLTSPRRTRDVRVGRARMFATAIPRIPHVSGHGFGPGDGDGNGGVGVRTSPCGPARLSRRR